MRGDWRKRYTVADETGCWVWIGAVCRDGYGAFPVRVAGSKLAHRAVYTLLVGPIPEGLQLDHLCRNRACVNPDHLEPVTPSENQRRSPNGYGMRERCRAGLHDITDPAAIYVRGNGERKCHACQRAQNLEAVRRYNARKQAARSTEVVSA